MTVKVVDLFSGAGGFSEGARRAGCEILWAGNHWPSAVEWHAKNHPSTQHVCQDLHQADWEKVPQHDLLLASPSCQGFSRARGTDKPRHDAARSTAWAVVSCAEFHRPELVLVENVPEFQQWVLFPAWELAMQALGYQMTPYVIDAADHGVPQNRVRLFIVCSRSKSPRFISLPKRPHQPAVIDWESGSWSEINTPGRSAATLEKITNGRRSCGERFLITYNKSSRNGRSIQRPLGTVTTRDRYGLVSGDKMRMLTISEYRAAMDFAPDYLLPDNHKLALHLIGNAVVPAVAKDIIMELIA
jgi:DNA (cytosine-5)-methyltransferase 1